MWISVLIASMWWWIENYQENTVSSLQKIEKSKLKKSKTLTSIVLITLGLGHLLFKIHLFLNLVVITTLSQAIMEEVKVPDSGHPSITTLNESLVSIRWINYQLIHLFLHKLHLSSIQVLLHFLTCKPKVLSTAQDKLPTTTLVFVRQVKWEVLVIYIRTQPAVVQITLHCKVDLQTTTLLWVQVVEWAILQTILHLRWILIGHSSKTSRMTMMKKIDYDYAYLIL